MEIRDYVRFVGRRLWILVLVPLVAGAIAFKMVSSEPQRYRSVATVGSADLLTGKNESEQYVADFYAAVGIPAIVDKVAEATGESPQRIRGGIRTTRLGSSSLIQVTYETTQRDPAKSVAVVEQISREALAFLFQSPVEFAQNRREEARKAVDASNAAMDAFLGEIGTPLPDEDYRTIQSLVSQLRVRFEEANADGETAAADTLEDAIEDHEAELAQLGPKVVQFNRLKEQRDPVLATLKDADEALQRAQARAAVSRGESIVVVSRNATPVARGKGIVRRTAAVTAASFLLAVGLVALLESSRSGRRERLRAAGAPLDRSTDGDRRDRAGRGLLAPPATSAPADDATVPPEGAPVGRR